MFKKIKNISEYVEEKIKAGAKKGYYAKFARIEARRGKIGEVIKTKTQDNMVETVNKVTRDKVTKELGWVVKNVTSDNTWIISDSVFKKKYENDKSYSEGNIYKPEGGATLCMRIDEDITFNAPWGEEMNIKKGGYLVVNNPNDIYGIEEKEFKETYAKCNKKGEFTKKKINSDIGGRK